MTVKSRYIVIEKSQNIFDVDGNPYPDIMTAPFKDFIINEKSVTYALKEEDVYRFDLLMLSFYGEVNYYSEMVYIVNNIQYLDDNWIGEKIILPMKKDFDKFLINYKVG